MTRRSWTRVLVAAVLALAVAVALPSCGGGEPDEGSGDTTTTRARQTTTIEVAGPPQAAYDALVGTALPTDDRTPPEVAAALEQNRPVVILFYVSGGADDGAVLESLQALQPTYGDVTFALYDFDEPDAYGSLSSQLKIDYPPQVTFIDTQGIVRSVFGGFVDQGTLNQQIVNIRQG